MNSLALQSLHGQVHRFSGVVDRFGGFPQAGQILQTLCVRELQLAHTEQPVAPDHWWFRLREDWALAGVEPGDTVLFTAKVQRCTKGWDDPTPEEGRPCRRREQVIGLGGNIRDLVVTHRARRHSVLVSELQEQVRLQGQLLAEAEEQTRLLEVHRDDLLLDVQQLQERLRMTSCTSWSQGDEAMRSCQDMRLQATRGAGRRMAFAGEARHSGAALGGVGR